MAIAKAPTQVTRPDPVTSQRTWGVMRQEADTLLKSGFLPKQINTPEKALAIIMKGRELGVPPMYALSNIAIIEGKPTAGAELMLALIYRDHGDDAIRIGTTTHEQCVIHYRRRSWTQHQQFAFTIEDAKRAGLLGKDNWQHYPGAMLRARCISAVARLAFPDSIGGLYTPEEMGVEIAMSDDGASQIDAEYSFEPELEVGENVENGPEIAHDETGVAIPRDQLETEIRAVCTALSDKRGKDEGWGPVMVRLARHLEIPGNKLSDFTPSQIETILAEARQYL